jgi:hypothetical protein
MEKGKIYQIIKRIKLHTAPLITADIPLRGAFVRETKEFYIFDTFRVKKAVVIQIRGGL